MRVALPSVLAVFMAQATMGVEAPLPGYTIVPMEWEVEVAPRRTEFLNGTIQEVYAKLVEINPYFQRKPLPSGDDMKRAPVGAFDRRATRVNCGTWPLANKGRIQEGINYLRTVPAAPRNAAGPGACGRNPTPKTLDNWGMIADSAQYILQVCVPAVDQVSGQNFESANWNTIVRGDSC
ncbi:hypothetical protein C8A03DRAFT_35373 [Achaetomium macrosporum]|uniref:Secreted protein n=1 Tax=Achaetomium macrosporum TaxID=79813 RepID=A0AAN7C786_9PEZI|nr:hypothetical protein C8A03DRAFT_35373 [Achaetomium macrosporum]